MNPGVPQDDAILPLAGTRQTEGLMMATKHPKVDVVTIGAGWTAAMLAAKLCTKGDDDGLARAGRNALDVPGLRPRPRQPALLGPLRDDGRSRPRDVDVAAEPERAGVADAPVRLVQPG